MRLSGLYLVTDRSMLKSRTMESVVSEAVQGGVSIVQLREKDLCTGSFIETAVQLNELLAPLKVPLIINDRVDVALAAGVNGIHLGQSDMPYHMARKLMGSDALIGVSVETIEQVDELEATDVDYFGVSGVFPTPTKRDLPGYWGLDGLRQVRQRSSKPLVAIGGINAGNARSVMDAGADMIAVVSAICAADDPRTAARELSRCIA